MKDLSKHGYDFCVFYAGFLLDLLSSKEDEDDVFLRNLG
jgi:hypothetical protein